MFDDQPIFGQYCTLASQFYCLCWRAALERQQYLVKLFVYSLWPQTVPQANFEVWIPASSTSWFCARCIYLKPCCVMLPLTCGMHENYWKQLCFSCTWQETMCILYFWLNYSLSINSKLNRAFWCFGRTDLCCTGSSTIYLKKISGSLINYISR